jgi:uncharacterized membrane protein
MSTTSTTTTSGPVTKALRWLGVLVALAITVWLLVAYPELPATVPTHFDATGTADGWGPRSSVLVLAGVMLVLSVGIALLSARPRILNYPVIVTDHNAQAVHREGERLMVWTLLALQVLYLALAGAVILGGSATALFVIGLAALLGAVAVGIVRVLRAAR